MTMMVSFRKDPVKFLTFVLALGTFLLTFWLNYVSQFRRGTVEITTGDHFYARKTDGSSIRPIIPLAITYSGATSKVQRINGLAFRFTIGDETFYARTDIEYEYQRARDYEKDCRAAMEEASSGEADRCKQDEGSIDSFRYVNRVLPFSLNGGETKTKLVRAANSIAFDEANERIYVTAYARAGDRVYESSPLLFNCEEAGANYIVCHIALPPLAS